MPAESLGNGGYYIAVKGKSIFIMGDTELGLRNGVYAFLYYAIGMETFSADTVIYNCGNTVVFPYNLEIIGKADIDLVLNSNYVADEETAHAMGMVTKSDVFVLTDDKNYSSKEELNLFGQYWHNSFVYLPYATHQENHPSWYSTTTSNGAPAQLCYTARGNEAEYRLMVATAYEKMKVYLQKNPHLSTVTFTIEDNNFSCDCDACKAKREKYESDSAAVVNFTNDLADLLKADYPDITLLFFAYNNMELAPNTVDEYTKCRDNVAVFYAPIFANFTKSFYDEANAAAANQIKAWSKHSQSIYLWLYNTNFNYYLFPYNSFETMAETNRFCVQYNVKFIYWEGQWEQHAQTGFTALKEYMNAKLGWNANYTSDELYDKFFPAYFGGASGTMRTLFNEMVAHMNSHPASGENAGRINEETGTTEIWDKATLEKWLGYINTAYSQVDANSVYYKHIKLESIFIRHALNALYGVEDATFKQDCQELGVERYSECAHDKYGYSCGNLQEIPNGINW